MSFIAKNPLTVPEVEVSPSMPKSGTRGLFAGKDGWYDIDSYGNVTKLGSNGESSNSGDKEIFTISMTMSINGDVVTFDKTFQEVKEAYDNGLAIILMLNDMMVFPNIDYYDEDNTFCIEICRGDIFRVFLFYESGVIEEVAYREHVSAEEFYTFIGDRANFPTDSENVVDELNKQYQNIKANEEYIETLNEQMGDIETALDGIITIQNTLIGGDAV